MKAIAAFLMLALIPATAFAGEYWIDPKHSQIRFTVKHMRLFKLNGKFRKFEGTVTFDKESQVVEGVDIKITANSVDTNNHERDVHLRTFYFLNTKKYPEIKFKLRKPGRLDENGMAITGDITLHGVTKPVELTARFLGSGTDLCRNQRVSIEVTGKINRTDFGINRQERMKDGAPLYADEMTLTVTIAGVLIDPNQSSFKCGNYPASRTKM